jgi:lipoyl-dependent peroxiredoxin
MLGKRENLQADDAVIDATVALIPNENGTFRLGAELNVTLPSIDDAQRAADLVRAAHQVCPYSSATRGNIDVVLTANGARL